MREQVWFIVKPGSERRFAVTAPPNPIWAQHLKADGYQIMRVEFWLPDNFDSADSVIHVKKQDKSKLELKLDHIHDDMRAFGRTMIVTFVIAAMALVAVFIR